MTELTGGRVLGLMLGFFAVIIAADATMIYKALSTFGGVDNVNAYREGVAYNHRIERAEAQSAAGWHDGLEFVPAPARLRIILRDAASVAVSGKTLAARIGRPATNRFDQMIQADETAPGVYEATLPAAIESGTWIVDIAVAGEAGSGPAYEARRRLWITP